MSAYTLLSPAPQRPQPAFVLSEWEQEELLAFISTQYLNPNTHPRVSALCDRLDKAKAAREATT